MSHLLINNTLYRDQGWDNIFSLLNRDKPFASLQIGAEIFLDPNNGELSWDGMNPAEFSKTVIAFSPHEKKQEAATVAASSQAPMQQDTAFSTTLAREVLPYFGKP